MKMMAVLMLVLLVGCGQKGDLYLPNDSTHVAPSAPSALTAPTKDNLATTTLQ